MSPCVRLYCQEQTAGSWYRERCTDSDPATGYTHFTTKYTYDPAGDLLSRSIPFAPDQYGRSDAQLADWKVTYERNAVGDPTRITDARSNQFENTFYDTGELRTTNRPSFFEVRDGMVLERERRSANAEKSDQSRERESTLGQTDFGNVDPEPLPDLLPQAGPTRLVYDAEMRLTKVRDVLDRERVIDYDAMGRVEARSWPFKSGNSISHAFAYDKHGNVTSYTDGEGAVTTYAHDGYDRQIEDIAPGAHGSDTGAAPQDRITRLRYDHNDNLRFTETPRGVESSTVGDFTFETGYDSLDRVAFEEAPDGGRQSYTYDVASNLLTGTRPLGQGLSGEALESFQTRMTYDDADRRIESRQQVDDGGTVGELVTELEYDADDNVIVVREPGAKFDPSQSTPTPQLTQTVYEGRRLPWKTKVGGVSAERTSIVEYDPNGNLRRLVNPRGVNQSTDVPITVDSGTDSNANLVAASENATVRRYDEHDLLVAERLPWNSEDERKFRRLFQRADDDPETDDRLRHVLSIVSPHAVSDEGDPVAEQVPRTSYSYYGSDWLRSISDQKLTDASSNAPIENRLIFLDYDERGAQVGWESKNFGESSAGRHIIRRFWPSGEMKERIAKKTIEGENGTTSRRYAYFYNRNGSLVGANDLRADGASDDRLTTVRRDAVERQSAVNEVWASGKDTVNTFDVAGNVRIRKTDGKLESNGDFTGADAKTTTFEYDSLDREVRMTVDPATGADRVTTTNYWPSGRRESRVKPNATTERWFFSTRGEVSRFERQRGGQSGLAREIDYGYDPNGNRDVDERGSHAFNPRNQLVRWTKPNNGRVTKYELNGDGAIAKKEIFANPSDSTADTTTTYAYRGERLRWAETNDVRAYYRYDDAGNVVRIRLESQVGGQFPEIDDTVPEADGCGEIPGDVANDETYYCYDEFERMVLSKGAGAEPEVLEYDGLDRRDGRRVVVNGAEVRRDLSYIGTSELLSRETDDSGTKRFYDYDSTGDRQGQQVTDGSSDRYRGYTKDANGSVLGLESDDGTVGTNQDYDYDPYGELENDPSGDAADNPFRFEGFYYDSGIASYDMHARHYRPEVGRFLTQDRYASASQDLLLQGDPLMQNRYAFAGANPVNNVEFDGHARLPSGGGGGDPKPCPASCQRVLDKAAKNPSQFEVHDPVFVRPPDAGREGRTLPTSKDTGGSRDETALYQATLPEHKGFGALMYTNVQKPGLKELAEFFIPQTPEELAAGFLVPACRLAKQVCRKLVDEVGKRLPGRKSQADNATPGAAKADVGLASRGLRPLAGTRVRPQGVPEGWRIRGTKTAGGTRYYDPANPGNSVRVMQGSPKSPYPNSQAPYVRWQRNGQPLDANGNVLPSANDPAAHIPLSQFRFRPELFE